MFSSELEITEWQNNNGIVDSPFIRNVEWLTRLTLAFYIKFRKAPQINEKACRLHDCSWELSHLFVFKRIILCHSVMQLAINRLSWKFIVQETV